VDFLKIILTFIINVLLLYIAIIILRFLLLPSIVVVLFVAFFRRKFSQAVTNIGNYLFKIAYSIDQLGNVVCSELFNLTLIKYKKNSYKFGNPDETISSVLGKNKQRKTLTTLGKWLSKFLNFLDRNHVIKSIEEDEKDDKNLKLIIKK